MKNFGEILKTGRERLGYTQEQTAQHLGIERKTYSTYESGRSEPKLELLKKMVSVLKISDEVHDFFSEHNVPREVNSTLQVPGPEASLLQLLLAQKELRNALVELEQRISEALLEAKDNTQISAIVNQKDKDKQLDKDRNGMGASGDS